METVIAILEKSGIYVIKEEEKQIKFEQHNFYHKNSHIPTYNAINVGHLGTYLFYYNYL